MQRKLLDILACPIDKHYPLDLIELNASGDKIIDGVLSCSECNRYYPIVDEIPVMLPDELRNKKDDLAFLTRWQSKLPADMVARGLPHHLS